MMHVRHFTPHFLRILFVSAMALVASGCSMAQTESFTFQADMPENFTISPMAYYASASGESCSVHNLIQSEQPKGVRPVEFKLPLTDTAKGCSMVLTKVVLHIEGQWGKRELDMSLQTPVYRFIMSHQKRFALSPRRDLWSFRASASGFFAR